MSGALAGVEHDIFVVISSPFAIQHKGWWDASARGGGGIILVFVSGSAVPRIPKRLFEVGD